MKSKKINEYFFFGTAVRYLQDVAPGWHIHDLPTGRVVLSNIQEVLQNLAELDLQVTTRAADDLRAIEAKLRATPKDARLDEKQAKELETAVDKLRLTLEAELKGFEAYVVAPKRIDAYRLLNDVPSLMAPGVFLKVPDVARYDLTEAGKCIAFERPTAAAFHLLRATESVLRLLYSETVKRNRVALMWGPIVQDLRTRRNIARADESLLVNLDDIRMHFRNPTQHPDKIYDIEEVQDLWGRCIDAINRMAKLLS